MKMMTEQMNAMIASMKENIPPANTRNKEVQGQGGGQGGGLGERQKKECPTARRWFSTNLTTAPNWKRTRTKGGKVGSWSTTTPDRGRGHGR